MALSGLDIFKLLPKTNCGECKLPTCLAFAMKLAGGQAKLEECPYVSDEAKEALAEAAAPPIRGVIVGQGAREFKTGEELVLFRHEKRFVNPTAMTVLVSDAMSDDEFNARVEAASKDSWERVGQQLEVKMLAVKCESGDGGKFKDVLTRVSGMTDLALMPMTEDVDVMKAAVEAVGDKNPLLYCATAANLDAMGALAKEKGLPLVLKGDGLDSLAELSEKAAAMELKDLVLDPGTRDLKSTLEALVAMRRGALNSKFKPFGFPTIALPCEETDDVNFEGGAGRGIHSQVRGYRGDVHARRLDAVPAAGRDTEYLHRPPEADGRRQQVLRDRNAGPGFPGAGDHQLLAHLLHSLGRGRVEQDRQLAGHRRFGRPVGSHRVGRGQVRSRRHSQVRQHLGDRGQG